MIGTHFPPVYTTRLSSSFSVHWVSGIMLALTHASFFGVVLTHLFLLGQEGLEARKGAETAALDSGTDSLKHTEPEQL